VRKLLWRSFDVHEPVKHNLKFILARCGQTIVLRENTFENTLDYSDIGNLIVQIFALVECYCEISNCKTNHGHALVDRTFLVSALQLTSYTIISGITLGCLA